MVGLRYLSQAQLQGFSNYKVSWPPGAPAAISNSLTTHARSCNWVWRDGPGKSLSMTTREDFRMQNVDVLFVLFFFVVVFFCLQ